MREIQVKTPSRSVIIDISDQVQREISREGFRNGLCHIFVPHTTAGITINENADPSVKTDMINILNNLVPYSLDYEHLEGNSDSHVKASMMGFSVTIAVHQGSLNLGQWQGIQFCEFDGPRTRQVHLKIIASPPGA